jgi:hypothetical protein
VRRLLARLRARSGRRRAARRWWRARWLHRAFLRLALAIIATRVWLYSWVMPHCVTKRFLVEVLPLSLVLAFAFTLRPAPPAPTLDQER